MCKPFLKFLDQHILCKPIAYYSFYSHFPSFTTGNVVVKQVKMMRLLKENPKVMRIEREHEQIDTG